MNLGHENETQEFKISLAQLDKGLKSLTAMLNRHGHGTVYFGVDDDGNVVGLTVGKNTLTEIRNKITQMIDPRIFNVIETLEDEGKTYIRVFAKGSDIPYSCDGRYYWRNVSSDEIATNELLRKMLISSEQDIIRQIPSENQNLTFTGLCEELNRIGHHASDTRNFQQSYGLFNRENQFNLLAFLLSDQNSFEIKVVRFEGTDKRVMSERTVYTNQCLLTTTHQVQNFIKSINTTSVNLSQGQRMETPLFSYEAFHEAWVNAVLHSSWHEKIPPSVFIFDDRIEVLSYGGLPYGLTKEGFFTGTSRPVNKGLLTVFVADRLSEQTGHGNPIIVANYGREAFSFENGMVNVTLRFAFTPLNVLLRNAQDPLSNNQRMVLNYLSSNPHCKLADLEEPLNLSLATIKKIVGKLQELGLVRREGSRRLSKWIVK